MVRPIEPNLCNPLPVCLDGNENEKEASFDSPLSIEPFERFEEPFTVWETWE